MALIQDKRCPILRILATFLKELALSRCQRFDLSYSSLAKKLVINSAVILSEIDHKVSTVFLLAATYKA
ncbi:hypothetical protein THIOM_003491 [Candidatus Thiomargarita nelsonii]|uniref:Uncharacterized protein n=1 Tax=Candidatus Thiomargarita nelsonii TaxID=1003181 RepID=A0A176RYB6_9GAMM|nr:hypothetical protein THIOM_003491 [Candidatus Thiomargarita nelsonii]